MWDMSIQLYGEGDTVCGICEYSFMVREVYCVGYVNTALW
jgi:hypothetical protein